MKALKYILLICAIVISAAVAKAVDVEAVLKERSRAAKLPPTDTAILYHGTIITIHPDGRLDRQEHIIRYLRSDNAWDDYGDPHLAYDAARQDLQVLVSRTHTVDGRKIDTTPNGFNPMVPFGLDLAPDFTHYQQMVVTHLGIENDAVTELQYVIRDKEPLCPWAWGEILFAGNEPILHRHLEVQIPSGLSLLAKEENGAPQPITHVLMDGEKQDVYVWDMKDLPATNLSEAGAKPNRSLPCVSFSTCPDWQTLTGEINRRFVSALADLGSLPQDLSALRQVSNEQQKLDSVVAFVKNRIALKTYDDQGFLLNFRPVAKIYNTGYGSPADLAAMYAAMLQQSGMQGQVDLVFPDDAPVAFLAGNEQYAVRLTGDAQQCWIDPNTGEITYRLAEGMATKSIYSMSGPVAERVPRSPSPPSSTIRLDLGISFKKDQTAEGWIVVKKCGALSGYEKARSKDAETLVADWTADLFSSPEVKDARIVSLDPDVVEVKADLSFPAPEKMLDGLLRMDIPWKAGEIDGIVPHGLALNYPVRDLPLFLDHVGKFEVNLQVNLPEEWKVASLPASRTEEAESIRLWRTVSAQEGKLTFAEEVLFQTKQISPQNWNAWRNVLIAANKARDRTILLNFKPDKQAATK